MTLGNETIKRLETVKVIDIATGALKRVETDFSCRKELRAIDIYSKQIEQKYVPKFKKERKNKLVCE